MEGSDDGRGGESKAKESKCKGVSEEMKVKNEGLEAMRRVEDILSILEEGEGMANTRRKEVRLYILSEF